MLVYCLLDNMCENTKGILRIEDQFQPRYIILHRVNDTLTTDAETSQSYDALKYPIIRRMVSMNIISKL